MGDTDDGGFLYRSNQILKMAAIMLVVFVLGVLAGHYWLPCQHQHREILEPEIYCPPLHHLYSDAEGGVPRYFCVMDK